MQTSAGRAPGRNPDVEFLTFLQQYRTRLFGTAFLLWGDAGQAERLVQHAVAAAYSHREHYLTIATEQLVRTDPHALRLPWQTGRRVELTDRPGRPTSPADAEQQPEPVVLTRLRQLDDRSRTALVLRRYLGLSAAGAGELLGLGPDEVDALVSRSLLALSDLGAAGRGGPIVMMESVVPPARDLQTAAAEDLAHGRQLIRRRRGKRSILIAAAAVVLLLVGIAVRPDAVTVVQVNAPPDATSSPTPSATPTVCTDPTVPACRVEITRDWRYRMAAIVTESLDPRATYFSGYSYDYDKRYDSDALWQGKGGALALDIFNADRGSTEVFLQVASSRRTAVRCGVMTKQHCIRQQMMDFNFFTMTESSDSLQGLEVQYCPDGTQVITIVVRDTTKGTPLVVDRGQVLQLIQDQRLQLPKV